MSIRSPLSSPHLRLPSAMRALKKSAVLYHYPCPDGAFAALAAHLYFSAASLPVAFFPNAVYDPIRPENLPLDEISDVYLLDFVGPSGFVADISSRVERVTILDHHKTALETLGGIVPIGNNVTKVIDMERSGATIAFDFFKEKLLANANVSGNHGGMDKPGVGVKFVSDSQLERVNKLFKYIEDGDLWRWALPHSKAFSSGLKDQNIEYDINVNLALFDQLLALDPKLVIVRGEETLLHKQKLIEKALEQSYEVALGNGLFGHCLAVDADSISNLRSELGHQLANKSRNRKLRSLHGHSLHLACTSLITDKFISSILLPTNNKHRKLLFHLNVKKRGIGAVVYKVPELNNDQMRKISLRSVDLEDTTPISKEYGGGGHRNASSFMLNSAEFERWKVQTEPSTDAND